MLMINISNNFKELGPAGEAVLALAQSNSFIHNINTRLLIFTHAQRYITSILTF